MPDDATNPKGTHPTTGEEVELPVDIFPEGTAHADQSSDPLPGAPA